MKTLEQFIRDYAFGVELNMNDVFGYATSAGVSITDLDLPKLLETEDKYGNSGVIAFASIVEDCDVIKPHKTKEFKEALEFLKDYKFWSISWCKDNYHCRICKCQK